MRIGLFVAFCGALATPAFGAVYQVSGGGTVNRISALQNSQSTQPPPGQINLGDQISISFKFDTDLAQLSSTFDTDPTVNIYYLGVFDFTATIGSYTYIYDNGFSGNSSLQTWNNRNVVALTDSQSFSFYGRGPNQLPFDTGVGRTLESLSLHAFDWTATARNSDLISEIAPFSSFNQKSMSWLQYNTDANFSVHVDSTFDGTIERLAAVPEPSTWAMMIVGFGFVGAASRRRNSVDGRACGGALKA